MCLLCGFLLATSARAEFFVLDLTLDAFLSTGGAKVRSFARAVLFKNSGERNYSSQVILGHDVYDQYGWYLHFARIGSDIGYANNATGDMEGQYETCYKADLAAHANAYNLHQAKYGSWKCIPAEPPPVIVPKENSPIILDLARDGYHLSGPQPPVTFDIDADGDLDTITWTSADEDEAFLCLDRNRNGLIDDGSELFGYSTPLFSGKPAKVGYRALAELDEPAAGGNGDGWVNGDDHVFQELCAWTDSNRDGVSQAQELQSLDGAGVAAVGFRHKTLHMRDAFGNLFRYTSTVRMREGVDGAAGEWPTYDVIFAAPR